MFLSAYPVYSWSAKYRVTFSLLAKIAFSKNGPNLETLVLSNEFVSTAPGAKLKVQVNIENKNFDSEVINF